MPAKGKEGYSARRGDQRRAALRPSRLGGQGDRRRHKEADSFCEVFRRLSDRGGQSGLVAGPSIAALYPPVGKPLRHKRLRNEAAWPNKQQLPPV